MAKVITKEIKAIDKIIREYVDEKTWTIKENANTDKCISGLIRIVGGENMRKWVLCYADSAATNAYKKGIIHLHDLDYGPTPYCCGWSLSELLTNGFGSSTPAKHFDTGVEHIATFLRQTQNEFAGAQAIGDFSILLAPYLKEDIKDGHYYHTGGAYEYAKQNIQKMVFMLNQKTRDFFQTPFTNITLNMEVPEHYKGKQAIVANKTQDYLYEDCLKEMDIINKAFFDVLYEGDKNGIPHTFPIPTINILPNSRIFEDNETTQSLWKLTAEYGAPYFFNYWGSGIKPYDSYSMCCRLRIKLSDVQRGGMWNIGDMTGSIAIATLSLPYIARISKDLDDFKNNCLRWFEVMRDYLTWKKDKILEFYDKGMFPTAKEHLRGFKSFFLTIGILGMHEALMNLGVKQDIDTVASILAAMIEKVESFKKETDWKLWNLEQTPAEGASYKLALKFKNRFRKGYVSGSGKNIYFTNSSHLPQYSDISPVDEIKYRDATDKLYTGGTLFNLYIGEKISPEGAKTIISRIVQKTEIPYVAITPTYSFCFDCKDKYSGGDIACPKCQSKNTEQRTRVVGYFRPVTNFNPGKKREFHDRKFKEYKKFEDLK